MGQSLTGKILSKASGKYVSPGEVVEVYVDLIAFHDLTGFHVIEVMEKVGRTEVFDRSKLIIVFDHMVPPPDVRSAEIQRFVREYVVKHNIPSFHDIGSGIMHQILLESYVMPGQVIVGADSHTSTAGALGAFAQGMGASDVAAALVTGRTWLTVPSPFKVILEGALKRWVTGKDVALELLRVFKSDYFNNMSIEVFVKEPTTFPIDYRATVANMGIELNADALMFIPDEVLIDYLRCERGLNLTLKDIPLPDNNAEYVDEYTMELDRVELLVAAPYSVDNVKSVRDVYGAEVDSVFIGSCTNGRLSDLEIAARIMKGRKVRSRCIVIPASRKIFMKAMELGYIQTLVNAGCVVTFSTCGPCIGGHFGVVGPNEVVVSTSNRNFMGRMGSPNSKTFLSGPSVAAATAVCGRICEPGDIP